jgi:ornithine carbamoyltransferase
LTGIKRHRAALPTLAAFADPFPMNFTAAPRQRWSSDRLSSADLPALLDGAAEVERAKKREPGWAPLRGRHVAVLAPQGHDAALRLQRTVQELGGSVTLLDASDWSSNAGARAAEAARMLGRLYDAVDCYEQPAALLEQIQTHCDVPVFDGLARAEHPLAALGASAVQALLVRCLR